AQNDRPQKDTCAIPRSASHHLIADCLWGWPGRAAKPITTVDFPVMGRPDAACEAARSDTQQEPLMTDLAGKTLFITGASRGIGKTIGVRAARDGANIVLFAKTT